ncbi:hypothetical protein ISCGN_012639 [Ixodes scapularis]
MNGGRTNKQTNTCLPKTKHGTQTASCPPPHDIHGLDELGSVGFGPYRSLVGPSLFPMLGDCLSSQYSVRRPSFSGYPNSRADKPCAATSSARPPAALLNLLLKGAL